MFLIRAPIAAGTYYNSDRNQLLQEIERAFTHKEGPKTIKTRKVRAIIAPHDKLHLSGPVSAWSYSKLEKSNYIIIGANHEGIGAPFSVMREGLWKTPLGEIAVDAKMAQSILDKSQLFQFDVTSHRTEHSIEMQLPFIQYRFGNDVKIVPIVVSNNFDKDFVDKCRAAGKAIANAIKADKGSWTIIASSDFTRDSKKSVESKDKKLISSMKSLGHSKFSNAVHDTKSSICGYGALLVMMFAAKELGAKKSEMLKYSTSYSVTQDDEDVAGYASIIIY